jgi:hypothetical protein
LFERRQFAAQEGYLTLERRESSSSGSSSSSKGVFKYVTLIPGVCGVNIKFTAEKAVRQCPFVLLIKEHLNAIHSSDTLANL